MSNNNKNVLISDFYDRVSMLDDESYPNSYIEFGDLIIEFKNARFKDENLICESIIKLKNGNK